MSLEISSGVSKALPSSVKNALGQMSREDQSVFEEEFKKKMKNPVLMLVLAIFFPIHYFMLGKIGLGIAFWISWGGFFIWYLIDIFRIWGMTQNYNEDLAKAQLRDMKIMNS